MNLFFKLFSIILVQYFFIYDSTIANSPDPIWDDCEHIKEIEFLLENSDFLSFDSSLTAINEAIKLAKNCDVEKVEANLYLQKLTIFSLTGKTDSFNVLGPILLDKLEKVGDDTLLGNLYLLIGEELLYRTEFDSSLVILNIAETFFNIQDSTETIMNLCLFRAIAYHKMGMYERAVTNYSYGLKIAKVLKNSNKIGAFYNNMASLYRAQNDISSSRYYYNEAYKIFKLSNNLRNESAALANLGVLEMDHDGDLDLADSLFQNSLQLDRKLNQKYGIASIHYNIGLLRIKQKKLAEAKIYLDKSLSYCKQNNFKPLQASNLLSISELILKDNQLDTALLYAEAGLQIAEDMKLVEVITSAYKLLTEIHQVKNDHEKALEAFTQYHTFNDSLFNESKTKTIQRLKTEYEIGQKDAEIKLLRSQQDLQTVKLRSSTNQRTMMAIIIISLVLIFALVAFYLIRARRYNTYLLRQQKEIIRKNEKLKNLSKEKDDLINIVAHDLKSPLNQIVGLNSLIKMEQDHQNAMANVYFDKIESTINTLRSRIERILDVERINTNEFHLNKLPIQPGKLCKEVYENFQGQAASKQISMYLDAIQTDDTISVDKEYLHQVLENLVSNAIKFSKAGEDITLRISETDQHMRIHIADNGPGISTNEQKLLFKKYSTLSAKPTGNEKSTGLGLAIVKRYTEAMGGSVWCESKLGHGSEFILEFEKDSVLVA